MNSVENTDSTEPKDLELPRSRIGAATLESVAKLAGVAPATVSRVLNHPEKVAKETRGRVNNAIAQTGYVPNLLAGGLASKRSRLIAAIVPSIVNLVYVETIESFDTRLRDYGYQVLLGAAGYSVEAEETLVTAILSRRPEAIFLTGIHHSQNCRKRLLGAGIPIVETWDMTPTPLDLLVGFSHEKLGQAVAAYLHNKGFRLFGIVSADDPRAKIRNAAFLNELQRRGVGEVMMGVVPAVSSMQRGREGMAILLDQGFHRGAVFCSSDTLAQGAIAEAQSRGIRVPNDIAIIGFGDQNFAAYTYPALTTVRIDRNSMGRQAAEALLARLRGSLMEQVVIDVGFSIIERETA